MNDMSTEKGHTYRRFREGETASDWELEEKIFNADHSYKCPTYVHKTPPCQGSCPSGEDIRGWLQIVRGIEKPPAGVSWQEYAFRRSTDANPFPSMMGRVCPAPCQEGCNRNEVDDYVGINAVEQYVGDWANANGVKHPAPNADTGRKVAVIGVLDPELHQHVGNAELLSELGWEVTPALAAALRVETESVRSRMPRLWVSMQWSMPLINA